MWCFRALARLRVSSSAVMPSSQLSLYRFLRTWLYVVGVYSICEPCRVSGVIVVWCGACAALGGAVREYAGTVVSSGTSGYSRCWSVSMLSGSWSPVAFFLACVFFFCRSTTECYRNTRTRTYRHRRYKTSRGLLTTNLVRGPIPGFALL
jgi:hypothetical protein